MTHLYDSSYFQYYKRMADRLDAESRLLFPVTFGIFCTVYWGYYYWSDTLQEHMKGATPYNVNGEGT